MRILAQRGDTQFLVTDSTNESDLNPDSQLVDVDQKLATPMPAQQALKWGYWDIPGDIPAETLKTIEAIAKPKTKLQKVANLIRVG